MTKKPTYEELAKRVKELEQEKLNANVIKDTLIKSGEWLSDKRDIKPGPENSPMDFDLGSIINVEEIQSIMNDFFHLTNMVTAVLDLKGNVIEATGWQDICTKFHRMNPKTACNCTESDLFLAKNLSPGEYVDYKCKNGLWDVVTPLYIGTKHLGNIFTGQFFYDDEKIDEGFFIKQAEKYGFDKDSYLDALRQIPRYNRDTIDHLMSFLVKFTTYISKISLSNTQLEKEIKKRKKAEADLRVGQARLQILIDSLPDLVWLKDSDGVYLSCNSKFEHLFGAKKSDIIGKTDYDFVDKELANFFRENDKMAIAAGKPCMNEEKVTYADDGHHEILETIKAPMNDSEGKLIGVLGIGRDITGRKRAEEDLSESKEKLRLFVEHAPAALAMFDNEMRYLAVSRRWMADYGLANQNIIGQSHYKIFPEIPDRWQALHQRGLKGEIVQAEEDFFERIDGTTQWLQWEIRPWYKADDTIGGIVIFTADLTERKHMEETQLKLKEQLHQAQKMESIGRLAGGVAHDFNNMLTIILGNTEMILEDLNLPNPVISNLQEIYKAAGRSANLTRQLLAFARKQTISPKVLDLNETIEGMIKMLRRLIGENINLTWLPKINLWPIQLDPSQIDQILANLCVNARDSIKDIGKVTIETDNVIFDREYCLEHDDCKPGDYVMIAVSDNGCGMDKKILDNLFEPFFTTKGVGEGTGLGLATVYGIVKQNKGFINVYSEPGQGTTFRIYFPSHAEKDLPGQKAETKGADATGSETILLVEDEEAILRMTMMMLERLGYTVLAASNPIKAIDLGKSHAEKIHLLMTDVVMPGMNGRNLAKEIFQLHPNIKCLFMSGYTANVIAHHGVLDDGMQFIQKPFSRQELAKKVREVLDEKKEQDHTLLKQL